MATRFQCGKRKAESGNLKPRRGTAHSSRRSGVILLVALSMLALFSVVVLAFVLATRQHRQAALAAARGKDYDPAPQEHLQQGALQVLRGTWNPMSVIGPHSILEDLYGNGPSGQGPLSGTVTAITAVTGSNNSLFELTLNPPPPETQEDYYNGRVITLYKGGRAESYRIVGYDGAPEPFVDSDGNGVYDSGEPYTDENGDGAYSPPTYRITVASNGEWEPTQFATLNPTNEDPEFILNGRAFSGTGFGFNPANFADTDPLNDRLDLNLGSGEIALLPNPRTLEYQQYLKNYAVHANEDYDAADYQNMILAFQRASSGGIQVPIPSLHRPSLINYWVTQQGAPNFNALPVQLKRKIMLRPLPDDHPSFPALADVLNGPWDVDNDGDGVEDSIWVDLGLPVQTAPDGRQYKPLFAILCLDMDGRLNLNVHGQLNDWNNDAPETGGTMYANPWEQLVTLNRPAAFGMTSTPEMAGTAALLGQARLPVGQGYGPHEVSLCPTMDNTGAYYVLPGVDDNQFRQLLRGYYDTSTGLRYEGRYGEMHRLPAAPANTNDPPVLAGVSTVDDNTPPPTVQSYGTPPDFDGNGVLGLDPAGQPRFTYMGTTNGINSVAETIDEAAELDLTRRTQYLTGANKMANTDNPFGPSELEALLRRNDLDSSTFTSRLSRLAPGLFAPPYDKYNAARVTTESWDIPVPSFTPTPEIFYGLRIYSQMANAQTVDFSSLTILDLIRGKLVAVNTQLRPPANNNATLVDNRVQILVNQDLVAPELLNGLRMNLNRSFWEPFVDSDGDGQYDNGEPYTDHNGNGVWDSDSLTEKVRFARHLFFLLVLLKDSDYSLFVDPTVLTNELTTLAARQEITARQLAQWSINVVEFRDTDLTMTPFEFVVNPFRYDPAATPPDRGWSVDQDPATDEASLPPGDPQYNADRRIVWGCEEPVLVLTETLAFHDRRVEDLAEGGMRVNGMMYSDDDYDQRRIPQGSAFFELYCTHNPNNPIQPSQELFNGTNLDLGKMAGDDPVWRLAITASRISDPDNNVSQRINDRPFTTSLMLPPQQFNFADATQNNVTIDRIVWFSPQKPGATHPDRDRVYYNRAASGSNVFVPGRSYVVVGPSRHTVPNSPRETENVTIIGWHDTVRPQEIALTSSPFHVTDNSGGNPYPSTDIQTPIGIAVGGDRNDYDATWDPASLGPVGISVSEPLFSGNYYPSIPSPSAANQTTYTLNGNIQVYDVYNPPYDEPLDNSRLLGSEGLLATGTTRNYRTVLLQRLANPAQPYDAVTNPYITVDWMPIDLTVFNGQSNPPKDDGDQLTFEASDLNDPQRGTQGGSTAPNFATRERGDPPATDTNEDLWSSVTSVRNGAAAPSIPDPPTDNFPALTAGELNHTLGYLNQPFHNPALMPPWLDGTSYGAAYAGSPSKPFPWLTWPNSPYISHFQLMQVPASSPSRLFWEYSMHDTLYGSGQNFYNELTDPVSDRGVPLPSTPYGHLLNFFHSSAATAQWSVNNSVANGHDEAVGNYYRLFDFVETPSLFSGTRMANNLPSPLSTYRVPGRVNANTICDDEDRTWLGITNSFNSSTSSPYASGNATWVAVRNSRQGYGGGYFSLNSTYPTRFAKPFRTQGNGNYVPLASLQMVGGNELIDNTFLRRTSSSSDVPLFSFLSRDTTGNPYDDNVLDTNSDGVPDVIPIRGHFNNSDKNPYFRYLMYQKLGNILTTRSNVYAVWITMGYFEVTRHAVDEGHPDGYQLQGEITSEIIGTRPKMFFLVDRSIPVGFSRGKNYNVHRAILLNRVIQ